MSRRFDVPTRTRAVVDSVENLVGGLGTAIMALIVLVLAVSTAVLSLVGVGLLFWPEVLRAVRALADRERERLGRSGPPIIGPPPLPESRRSALADPTVRR